MSYLRKSIWREYSCEVERIVEDNGGNRQQYNGFIFRRQPVSRYFKKFPASKYQE